MENNKPKKKSRKLSSNGFYAVLSLCLIAVGVAAWSAVSAFSDFKKQSETPKIDKQTPIETPETTIPDEPAQNELPNIQYETEPNDEPAQNEQKEEVPTADTYIMPVKGNISKRFDSITLQYSATLNDMRLHEGIDILADKGTPVRAVGSGTVAEVYEDATYGYIVVIDHGNDVVAKYCGLDKNLTVKSGQTVVAGTEIGTVGTVPIESADDPHLHFEMFKNGKAHNPLEIMGMEE